MSLDVHSRCDEYRKLVQAGQSPGIEHYVQRCGNLKPQKLVRLLILDQLLGCEGNAPTPSERYFDLFPELRDDTESAIDLVFSEFMLCERLGLDPDIEEFVERFPDYGEELRRQAAFQRAMEVDQAPSVNSPQDLGNLEFEADSLRVPDIPGYQIVGELGRGGIGVVYKARHVQLNRYVALKVLLAGHFASASHLRRFLVEAEATARLQHHNIVQIYEVGQSESRPFLALEHVNGGTLSQWADGRPQPPRDAAAITQCLAKAVQFAHEQGVVHRDIKTSNVLIQRLGVERDSNDTKAASSKCSPGQGDPVATSRPSHDPMTSQGFGSNNSVLDQMQLKVSDFGLAKLMAGGSDSRQGEITMSGDILGTAAYMSPEQARGESATLTAATDIYSLGAILYELLTGRPPFVGVQPMEILAQVIHQEPVRPSQIVRRVPTDIQTICLKCLEKNPACRYPTAEALADDLGRFLADQPILARKPSSLERLFRWCRHNRAVASVVLSIAIGLMLITALSSIYSVQLGWQLEQTSKAKDEAQKSKVEAYHRLWESRLAQANAIRVSNQIGQRFDALDAIEKARALGENIRFTPGQFQEMRNATIACLAKPDLRIDRKRVAHKLLRGDYRDEDEFQSRYACVESGSVLVIRVSDGQELVRIPLAGTDPHIKFSHDGMRLAIVNETCRVYELVDETARLLYESPSRGAWGFTPDGTKILGTLENGQFCLVGLDQGEVISDFGAFLAINDVSVSRDARRVATFDGETVRIIDLETAEVLFKIDNVTFFGQKHFAWRPDSHVLAIGPIENEGIELWNVDRQVKVSTLRFLAGESRMCFSSSGERLLTYDLWQSRLILWNVLSGAVELTKSGASIIRISATAPDEFRLLQWGKDGQLNSLVVEAPRVFSTLAFSDTTGGNTKAHDLSFSSDGQLLAVAMRDGGIRIFDSHGKKEFVPPRTPAMDTVDRGWTTSGSCYVQFVGNESLLTSDRSGLARRDVIRTSEGNVELGSPESLSQFVAQERLEVCRDGRLVAMTNCRRVEICGLDGLPDRRPIGAPIDVRGISVSPDGKQVATGEWLGGKVCVWDVSSGELIHSFEEPHYCHVQFSPNGKWLVTNAHRVRIWDTQTWNLVADLPVEGTSTSGVCTAFSPDSQTIAVSDANANINFFDPQTGQKTRVLTDPNHQVVWRMTFNPDGSQLAVRTTVTGAVHLWDLQAIREELKSHQLDESSELIATPK
jgi:serine/threonine protein kinase/WD40 repeat protein